VASGGGECKVKIWKASALFSAEAKDDKEVCLAVLTNHSGAVNCVRWSKNGKYLASCSDDKTVIIWELMPGVGTVFGSENRENWRCKWVLRGHTGDVADLAWSPDSTKIASCSMDNSVIIWELPTAGQDQSKKQELRSHTGIVKGVAWDPIGRFLASQSDDKSLIIWRVSDYKLEHKVTIPFKKSTTSIFFKRPSWSPDGSYLVCASGVKQSKHVASIVRRGDWSIDKEFVGHQKPVVCTNWNPRMFRGKTGPSLWCAIGAQDNLMSLWHTDSGRAKIILKNVFTQSVLDICWSADGFRFVCCSGDGTMAACQLDESELGEPIPQPEVEATLKKLYGDLGSVVMGANNLVEDPSHLGLEEQLRQLENKHKNKKKKKEIEAKEKKKQKELYVIDVDSGPESPLKRKTKSNQTEIDLMEQEKSFDEEELSESEEGVDQLHTNGSTASERITASQDSQSQSNSRIMELGSVRQLLTVTPDGKKRITPQFVGSIGTAPSVPSVFSSALQATTSSTTATNLPMSSKSNPTIPTLPLPSLRATPALISPTSATSTLKALSKKKKKTKT